MCIDPSVWHDTGTKSHRMNLTPSILSSILPLCRRVLDDVGAIWGLGGGKQRTGSLNSGLSTKYLESNCSTSLSV